MTCGCANITGGCDTCGLSKAKKTLCCCIIVLLILLVILLVCFNPKSDRENYTGILRYRFGIGAEPPKLFRPYDESMVLRYAT